MKKVISIVLSLALFSTSAMAECDFSTGISKNDNGSYTYTRECHLKVGEMKQDLEIANKQVEKLNKALDLKDLAITRADQRADLWMNTSFKLEDRVNTIDEMRKTNQWLYFGLGFLAASVAVYAAGQLR